jgi:hypothetical protein
VLVLAVGVAGCANSDSTTAERAAPQTLPSPGAVVYSVISEGLVDLEASSLRGTEPSDDASLTQTDHRIVARASADGRVVILDDFHAEPSRKGTFVRWRERNGPVKTRRITGDVAGVVATCGSEAIIYLDGSELTVERFRSARKRVVATPQPPDTVECSVDGRILALTKDGTLLAGTARSGLATVGDLHFQDAAISPDGTEVAGCTAAADARPELILLSPDGSVRRRLADGDAACEIAWAPDGRHIAMSTAGQAADDSTGRLTVVCTCGRSPVELVAGSAGNPVWSPDGTALAFNELFGALRSVTYPSGRKAGIAPQGFAVAWLSQAAAKRAAALADPYPCC